MAPRLIAAVALLALVAFASTARLERDQAVASSELALIAILMAAGAALALGVGVVAAGGGYAAFAGNRRRTNLVVGLLLAAVLGFLAAVIFLEPDEDTRRFTTDITLPQGPGGRREPPGGGGEEMLTLALAVGLGALLALLIAGAAVLYFARHRASREPTADKQQTVVAAIDESIDDLLREPDVRRAIIACYARMERALDVAGSPRRPAEAPFEYLVRVLERITDNAAAARTLTDLFERAKFSVEAMGEAEKDNAIMALQALRREVTTSSEPRS
jgi:hypothetical protein